MVCAEAGVDWRVGVAARIIDAKMAAGTAQRKRLGGRVIRTFLAERWHIARVASAGGNPDPAVAVHHRIVHRSCRIPDLLVAPVGRGRHGRLCCAVVIWVFREYRNLVGAMGARIQHRQIVSTVFQCAVNLAIGIHRRIAAVGGNQIMQIGRGVSPVPLCNHHIAF